MYILAFICITINAVHAFHIFVLIVAAIDVMFTVSERGCGNCCGLSRACCSFPVCVLPSFTCIRCCSLQPTPHSNQAREYFRSGRE